MRGRTLAALIALAVVDLLVLVLGYRAYTGSVPPLQRSASGFGVDRLPTAEPTTEVPDTDADVEVEGPLLLGVNADGDVLRATRGACEERFDNPARIWSGNVRDGAPLAPVDPPAIREILGLMVFADRSLRVSGLDDACRPVTYDSADSGASWVSNDDSGIWRMFADVQASSVTGPAGLTTEVPCPAAGIVNLAGRRAVGSCASQVYFLLVPGQPARELIAEEYSQLSVTTGFDPDSYFLFGATDKCAASVAVARTVAATVEEVDCFDEDKTPLAIASAGRLLVLQLGNDLMVSRDEGDSFETVGEPAAVEDPSSAES